MSTYPQLLATMATLHDRATRDSVDYRTAQALTDRDAIPRERIAFLSPDRRGDAATYTAPAPSAFVSTVSDRKARRNSKGGTTTTVTRRGRVWVAGDSAALDDQLTRSGRVPRVVIADAIDRLRGGNRFGHVNGDALAALTTRLYDVPELIGTDQWSWSAATPEVPTRDVGTLAAQTCGLTAGIVPSVDSFTMPAGEWRAPRKPRTRSARRRVTMPRKRASDPLPREHVVLGAPWRTWHHVTELIAGTDDVVSSYVIPDTVKRDERGRVTYVQRGRTVHVRGQSDVMFVGHRRVTRGKVKRTAPRHAVIRDAFVIDSRGDWRDHVTHLAAIVAADGPGKYEWRTRDHGRRGRISVDKRGRVSVTERETGATVRQARTLEALTRQLAAQ